MRRPIMLTGILVLLVWASAPTAVLAGVPEDQYQVLSARNASAAFSSINGCLHTQLFISSTDAVFGGRPGAVNKQGLTSVGLFVYDTCQRMEGKHFPAVFSAQSQDFTRLASSPRLDRAWVATSSAMFDEVSGQMVQVAVDVSWLLEGALHHDPSHTLLRIPGSAMVTSHDNDLIGSAVASGTITVAGVTSVLAPTHDAHLELIKAHCQVVVHPRQATDLSCI